MKSRKEVLMHPIRMEILEYLNREGSATAGKLAEALPDVPKTTLYRHINVLADEGYLKVVDEKKIRGTLERVYELNTDYLGDDPSAEKSRRETTDLLLRMMTDFEDYYDGDDVDPDRDMLFFTENTIDLSDGEFSAFLEELFALLAKYDLLDDSPSQKPRSITMISSPVTSDKLKAREKRRKEAEEEARKKEKDNSAAEVSADETAKTKQRSSAGSFGAGKPAAKTDSHLSFKEAMELVNPSKKLTERGSHGIAFEMPVNATYDMTEKVIEEIDLD